jgi:CII-binding regulator of phage lambda lysogenization HflD
VREEIVIRSVIIWREISGVKNDILFQTHSL